jgi:regulator of protease activity HflC (stomatin/prohibitin superfamily)
MRIDHFAYQRATKVAGFGLMLQAAIGVLLLTFGLAAKDTPFTFAALYVLPGVLVWLGLVIIFHQHKLERLEALEEDELAATRGSQRGSVFEKTREESRVAARRLGLMHKWFMPGLSVLLALMVGALLWWMLAYMRGVRPGRTEFLVTEHRGWAIAVCLGIAALSFIFARFVAGMAKQEAWANLRGGAAYMVGNALVLVAVAAGIIFRFFDNQKVIEGVAWAIPVFMGLLAVEIVLNFILNLYRPRIPGEVPRPAFDSKVLSLLAAPDNIVRSVNEAVNYQFGFDVTSSWGYQLLLRSFAWLAVLAVAALVLLSTMVVVEPYQQAVRLRGGAIVGGKVYGSGIMWKWPWPIETAAVYDVSRLRSLWLTARVTEQRVVDLWKDEAPKTDTPLQAFIVGSPASQRTAEAAAIAATAPAADTPEQETERIAVAPDQPPTEEDVAVQAVSALYSLVDAEMVLQYRIKANTMAAGGTGATASGGGLVDYLMFASDEVTRLQDLTERERALRGIALAAVSAKLSRLSLDDVLSPGQSDLTQTLATQIQAAFDQHRTGVEVLALEIPMLRPAGASASKFEELGISMQAAQEFKAAGERNVSTTYTYWIGDASQSRHIMALIEECNALQAQGSPEAAAKRREVERLLVRGRGHAAQIIANAERDRWVDLMRRRARASTLQAQLPAYQAAPRLFREREIMRIYAQVLPPIDKFVIGIDPARVTLDMDLKKTNPILNFAGVSEEEATQQ